MSSFGDASAPGPQIEAFRRGLRDLGYIEGKNILIEYRDAEGNLDRAPALIAELVQLKVDILVVTSLAAIRAAKQATKTTPIGDWILICFHGILPGDARNSIIDGLRAGLKELGLEIGGHKRRSESGGGGSEKSRTRES